MGMSLWFCRILRWAREEENRIKENNGTTLKCIILDMTGDFVSLRSELFSRVFNSSLCSYFLSVESAVSAIDTSGLEAVFELRRRLEKQSLQVIIFTENKDQYTYQKEKPTNFCQTLLSNSLCW